MTVPPTPDRINELALEGRVLAHRAVTEGVNLKYVDLMRLKMYEMADELAALAAAAPLLVDALERYGQHEYGCMASPPIAGQVCTCGLDEALLSYRQTQEGKP